MRMVAARDAITFRDEIVAALGGEEELSPQRRKLVELAARASLLLDAVDRWIFEQPSPVNARAKAILPVLTQRQSIAEHLAKLLDKLGLDRVPQRVLALDQYVRERYGADDEMHPERKPGAPESTREGGQ